MKSFYITINKNQGKLFSYKHQRIHWCEAACLWHKPSKSQHAIRYLITYTRACIHKVIHPAIRQDHFRQPQDIAIEVQLGSTLREMHVIQKRCIQAFAVLLWQFHGLRRDFIPNIPTLITIWSRSRHSLWASHQPSFLF